MAEQISPPKLFFLVFLLALNSLQLLAGGRVISIRSADEMVFFVLEELMKPGAQFPIYFPLPKDPSTSPHFISRQEADSIPFSSGYLPHLLRLFSFPPGSQQAAAMKLALSLCEAEPMRGETKTCPTSLDSMLEFAQRTLTTTSIQAMSTRRSQGIDLVVQNYTVLGRPREGPNKLVACHWLPYPYKVFMCHSVAESKVFLVDLVAEKGDRVEAVGICHMDTSQWDAGHVAFRVLGVEPGFSGVCHFLPEDDVAYVPAAVHQSHATQLPAGN